MPKELSAEQVESLRLLVVEEGMGVDRAIYRLDLPLGAGRRVARERGWKAQALSTKVDEDGVLRRRCRLCGSRKPLTDFTPARQRSGGHLYECKECRAVLARQARASSKGPAA